MQVKEGELVSKPVSTALPSIVSQLPRNRVGGTPLRLSHDPTSGAASYFAWVILYILLNMARAVFVHEGLSLNRSTNSEIADGSEADRRLAPQCGAGECYLFSM